MYLFGWCLFSRVSRSKRIFFIRLFLINSWRITVTIGKMTQIELSTTILIKLMQHLKSVPLLFSNMMETLHRINLYCKFHFRLFLLYYIFYFLVTIFPPHTTVEVDLSIQRCFLLLTQYHTSILTGEIFLIFLIN